MGYRRLTKTIEISSLNQVVPLDFRLSGNIQSCEGVQVIIVGKIPTDRPIIPNFGEYSLEFEGKKNHSVSDTVPYYNQALLGRENFTRLSLLPLSIPLIGNNLIKGYYLDTSNQNEDFISYKVKFIFSI